MNNEHPNTPATMTAATSTPSSSAAAAPAADTTHSYRERRGELATYFDRTASDKWVAMTSDTPLNRIRATVRAGRERMRATLLSYLPAELNGRRLFDAGCGTGMLSMEVARRGASIVAIDLAGTLVAQAQVRAAADPVTAAIDFRVGDMFDPALGEFDHVVAMDSLIHYDARDVVRVVRGFAARTRGSIVFTFAPKTGPLALMHAVGKFFPRGDRSPAIVPVGETQLRRLIAEELPDWRIGRSERIVSGFYTSQALELLAPGFSAP
ncbi:magnesium protoporphyrin IX methyltransferase [Rhodocyclus tenuis]|uniref:Magnesium protoporphyrin IX methyltransferase n=1 Tax=Rhodocyclus tenuis TaxID=1066 RepID=A0A840GL28_RHOTE|nr:magnesium protoporphyrin IX methyltransferase [Rhodocyclus tenuis]MBB4249132.1 magnesium-protoporphyrin O-methyltransferase [Rhodocyclus tenuis]